MPKGLRGFQKGHKSFIKKAPPNYRNCLRCDKQFIATNVQLVRGWGKYCSRNCSNKHNRRTGEQLYNWKGENVSYGTLHDWIQLHYGKANKCESLGCKGISKKYEWAKIRHKRYERKRENFWMLCKSCHTLYDYTEKQREFLRKRGFSKATRKKISKSLKKYYAGRNYS